MTKWVVQLLVVLVKYCLVSKNNSVRSPTQRVTSSRALLRGFSGRQTADSGGVTMVKSMGRKPVGAL